MTRSRTKKVIKFRQTLFWDVDPKTIDPQKNARYIIERIIDFGSDEEAKWIYEFYPHRLILDVVKKSRGLHPVSRPLWESLAKS